LAAVGNEAIEQAPRKDGSRRGPNRFLKSETTRAIKAAKAAGASKVEIEPATGKITVLLGPQAAADEDGDSDRWAKLTEEARAK
jgi:hypothetical protein